jgi:hypothetical protein
MIPDNYSQWEYHERQAERWLASRPICCWCGEHIQEEPVYHPVTGEEMCPGCLEEYEEEQNEEE